MAEESTVTVSVKCWRERLLGFSKLQMDEKIAQGETCPNDGQWKDVVVSLYADENEILNEAIKQIGKCELCGLKPERQNIRI